MYIIYDFESGLYYFKSRYYNPSIGIFIQPDEADYLQFDDIKGYGLYTYCFNNPVLYSDPEGNIGIIASLVLWTVIGAIDGAVSFGAGYASGYLGLRTPTYNYKIGNFMKVARFLFEKTLSVPMYILNMLE